LAIFNPTDNLDDEKDDINDSDGLNDSDDNGVGGGISLLISRKFKSSPLSNKLSSSLFFIKFLQFSIASIIILFDSSYSFKMPAIYKKISEITFEYFILNESRQKVLLIILFIFFFWKYIILF
jgi:hypothetical protein